VADQAEVRPQALLGRPDDPRRQRRAGVDGLQDLRLRRRPRRRLGAEETSTGAPRTTWLGDERYSGDRELENPLGAVQMGLIYVNPEGPERQARPARLGARHPRDLRPHGDERRGDRGADRRRPHLRQGPRRRRPGKYVGPEPEAADLEEQGLGWKNSFGTGKGVHTITSGLEGAWTPTPIQVGQRLLRHLFGYEWELTKSPAGAQQWKPKDPPAQGTVPDAHDPTSARADDDHGRHGAAHGPGLREDLAPLPWPTRRSSPTPSPAPGSS
jgi:hypothetical protein